MGFIEISSIMKLIWNYTWFGIVLIAILHSANCKSGVTKIQCYRDYFNGSKFIILSILGSENNTLVKFEDSLQYEFKNDVLLSKNKLAWRDCDTYLIIPLSHSDEDVLKAGDTLRVDILRNIVDTFIVQASAKGASFEMKMVKARKVN